MSSNVQLRPSVASALAGTAPMARAPSSTAVPRPQSYLSAAASYGSAALQRIKSLALTGKTLKTALCLGAVALSGVFAVQGLQSTTSSTPGSLAPVLGPMQYPHPPLNSLYSSHMMLSDLSSHRFGVNGPPLDNDHFVVATDFNSILSHDAHQHFAELLEPKVPKNVPKNKNETISTQAAQVAPPTNPPAVPPVNDSSSTQNLALAPTYGNARSSILTSENLTKWVGFKGVKAATYVCSNALSLGINAGSLGVSLAKTVASIPWELAKGISVVAKSIPDNVISRTGVGILATGVTLAVKNPDDFAYISNIVTQTVVAVATNLVHP